MISQNIAERPLNVTSVLNNFKSFMKQIYQKEWAEITQQKYDQNNYFRAEITQKDQKLLTIKEIKKNDFY